MKIPGWVFMLVGAVIVGYSRFVEAKQGSNLALFFWAGLIFLAYGLGKEMFHRLQKPKEKEKPKPPTQARQRHHAHPQSHQHTKPHPHQSHPHEPRHKQCPHCHHANAFRARFCQSCGYRMV